jgi:hypothetical protein
MRPLISKRISQWLLPAVLILFILEVLTLPLVLEVTYAGREDGPDHILTYTTGSLLWDSATGIDEYGVARLDLFHAVYDETVDGNGENVVAPGTAGLNILRLKNEAEVVIEELCCKLAGRSQRVYRRNLLHDHRRHLQQHTR